MLKLINKIISFIAGNAKLLTLENRLFNSLALINGLSNVLGSLNYINFSLGTNAVIELFKIKSENLLFWIHFISGSILIIFYLIARLKAKYKNLYWPFILTILIFLFVNFFFDAGSQGGAHYYLITIVLISVILAPSNFSILASLSICLAMTFILFYIEYSNPSLIHYYTNTKQHFENVPSTFLFMQLLNGVLVLVLRKHFDEEREKSDNLLLNILPKAIADELKISEEVKPIYYESATVLFTDFVSFTRLAENLTPQELIERLDEYFKNFDNFVSKYSMEKIKTIGDAYMAVGGVPTSNNTHFFDAILTALEIREYVANIKNEYLNKGIQTWDLRIGIHTGPIVAGVIGKRKFAYDIWGDAVNIASRLETTSEPGKINISSSVFVKVKDYFVCTSRGEITAKNKGKIDMYYIERLNPIYSLDLTGNIPNQMFWDVYNKLKTI